VPPPPPRAEPEKIEGLFDDDDDDAFDMEEDRPSVPTPAPQPPSKKRAAPTNEPSGVTSPKKARSSDADVIAKAAMVEGKRSRPAVKRLTDEQPANVHKRSKSTESSQVGEKAQSKKKRAPSSNPAIRAPRNTKEKYNNTAVEYTLGTTIAVKPPTPSLSWPSTVEKGVKQTKEPLPDKLPSSSSTLWIGCKAEGIELPKDILDKIIDGLKTEFKQAVIRAGWFGLDVDVCIVDRRRPNEPIVRVSTHGMAKLINMITSKCEAVFTKNVALRNTLCPTGNLVDMTIKDYTAAMLQSALDISAKKGKNSEPTFAEEYAKLPTEDEFVERWIKRMEENPPRGMTAGDLYDDADEDEDRARGQDDGDDDDNDAMDEEAAEAEAELDEEAAEAELDDM